MIEGCLAGGGLRGAYPDRLESEKEENTFIHFKSYLEF